MTMGRSFENSPSTERHSERSEESGTDGEILRFAQDDGRVLLRNCPLERQVSSQPNFGNPESDAQDDLANN